MDERLSAKPGWWRSRVRSFGYAFSGLKVLLLTQPHAQIHAVATVLVTATGWLMGLSPVEWACVVAAMGLVWVSEALNTALEFLANVISPEPNPLIGKAKDMAAGAVLLASIAAVVIGIAIFAPHLRLALQSFTTHS